MQQMIKQLKWTTLIILCAVHIRWLLKDYL